MGHIGAYIPHLWGCYPPPIVLPCLFFKYAPTVGRENFHRKNHNFKNWLLLFTKIHLKSRHFKNFFPEKIIISKMG